MYDIAKNFGRAFIISGLVPALIFVILNVFFFTEADLNFQELNTILKDNPLGFFLVETFTLAILLLVLNTPIIKFYEGSHGIPKFFLRYFLKKNLSRHERLFSNLQTYKSEYNKTENNAKRNSLAHAMEQEWKKILPEREAYCIPMDKRRVLPTRLGNIFAIIEEYPNIRYGMDGMVYWPRLIPFIPKDYSEIIANEKISFNFLLNLSLLSGVFSVELLVKFFYSYEKFEFLLFAFLFMILAYALYRFSTMTAVVMGELIKSGFDLFRHEILKKMNITIPEHIEEERNLWYRLANYISSGEPFYYPSNEKATEQKETAMSLNE